MKPGRAQQSRRAPLGALLWRRICAGAHVFFRRQVGQKEKELQKIKDEKSTVGSALNDHESPSSKSRSRIEYDD